MRILRCSIFCLIMCLYVFANTEAVGVIQAQTASQKVIYQGPVQEAFWSADSQQIVITTFNEMEHYVDTNLHLYDVNTQSLTVTQGWPFQPILNRAEQAAFMPASYDDVMYFMHASPNNRYVAYAKQTTADTRSTYLTIGARTTLTRLTTPFWIPRPDMLGNFIGYWSADSSSFLFDDTSSSGAAVLYYVTNFSARVPTVAQLGPLALNGILYYYYGRSSWGSLKAIYDISTDGTSILTYVEEMSAGDERLPEELAIWKPSEPTSSQILHDLKLVDVMAAKFVAGSSSRLVIINREGLFLYDIASGKRTLVTSLYNAEGYDIDETFSKRAFFSPNNRWLAIKEVDLRGTTTLNLVDLQQFNLNAPS